MTEENIASRLARQDANLHDLERNMNAFERNIKDHGEDSRTRSFSESIQSEIARTRQTADGVHDAYTTELKKLYREDGQKKFSEAEHQELADDLKRQRDEAFAELKQRAEKVSSEIGEKLEVVALPERYLSDKEMERANSRRDFVREDVERLREQLQLPGARIRKEGLEALRQEAAGLKSHVRDKSITHEERVAASRSPFR